MVDFDRTHISMLAATFAFLALSMFLVSKMSRRGQNFMFVLAALACSGIIFFNCAMGLDLDNPISWKSLGRSMLQVCQFNMILVLLMLVPKFELARQYSFMFSMFAAFTTFVSLQDSWANLQWYSPQILSSWIFHLLAIALPLWMVAARRLKPQKKYVLWVGLCVIAYFTTVYLTCEKMLASGQMSGTPGYSFIYISGDTFPLQQLYDWIGIPFYYLMPLIPPMFGFFYLLAVLFEKYQITPFRLPKNKKS